MAAAPDKSQEFVRLFQEAFAAASGTPPEGAGPLTDPNDFLLRGTPRWSIVAFDHGGVSLINAGAAIGKAVKRMTSELSCDGEPMGGEVVNEALSALPPETVRLVALAALYELGQMLIADDDDDVYALHDHGTEDEEQDN